MFVYIYCQFQETIKDNNNKSNNNNNKIYPIMLLN